MVMEEDIGKEGNIVVVAMEVVMTITMIIEEEIILLI